MQRLAQRVCEYVRKESLLLPGNRVGVAVSGGADSVALLRLLLELRDELGLVLSVVHFHHQIRGHDADADQLFVAELASSHGLELHVGSGDTPQVAEAEGLSMEAAARALRYGCFAELISSSRLDKVATGHTLDDQAETVLLKLVRGAGTRGLAGIYPCVQVEAEGSAPGGGVVRPLLRFRRAELRDYLDRLGQHWREDASNTDLSYRRNRVRQQLVPLLETGFNPKIVERLGEVAEIARAEEQYWEEVVRGVLVDQGPIPVASLRSLPAALQRRLVRAAAQSHGLSLSFEEVERIISLAESSSSAAKYVTLSQGWQVRRRPEGLQFLRGPRTRQIATDYEYLVSVPCEVPLEQSGAIVRIEKVRVTNLRTAELLSAGLLHTEAVLRNWRAGDRFWPPHAKGPKKVKELLQDRHIPIEQRRGWPVIFSGGEIVWMRGFSIPIHLQPSPNETEAILIQETAWPPASAARQ
jgi:tRNA(Ile)-lysidine synthase